MWSYARTEESPRWPSNSKRTKRYITQPSPSLADAQYVDYLVLINPSHSGDKPSSLCINMQPKASTVWYLAYGSNMSSAKFTGSRGIHPLESARIRIPGWVLVMEIPGLPYSEPAFSSITPRQVSSAEKAAQPDVVGVAYLISSAQYRDVIASEGGGTAYLDIDVVGEPIGREDRDKTGDRVHLRTLGTAMLRRPFPSPSQRYMVRLKQESPTDWSSDSWQDLITAGGKEARLPEEYQRYLSETPVYKQPSSSRTRLGATLFLAIWGPVMFALEQLTRRSIQKDGNAHWLVVLVIRWIMFLMWAVFHDCLFAPVFGRGDGL